MLAESLMNHQHIQFAPLEHYLHFGITPDLVAVFPILVLSIFGTVLELLDESTKYQL
jgi:hypothetical protein